MRELWAGFAKAYGGLDDWTRARLESRAIDEAIIPLQSAAAAAAWAWHEGEAREMERRREREAGRLDVLMALRQWQLISEGAEEPRAPARSRLRALLMFGRLGMAEHMRVRRDGRCAVRRQDSKQVECTCGEHFGTWAQWQRHAAGWKERADAERFMRLRGESPCKVLKQRRESSGWQA